ncbi:unnamed protein product [Ilex paraguariensis]|uniref:Uncharacterized protein n=1 Tax=Ilex paraguariensis TaxID=185542 RepID=A0ABC8UIG9_9AQUA
MAIHKIQKNKSKPRSPILILSASLALVALLFVVSSVVSTNGFSISNAKTIENLVGKSIDRHIRHNGPEKYLYWGNKVDCPGKHCDSCEGLGHQESSLRCALEEAIILERTFVMPSRMCINPIHNKKGILHQSKKASFEEMWAASSCAMDSLYDLDLISQSVPVILDNSKMWYRVLSTSMKLGSRGVAHVEGVSRADVKGKSLYSNILLINRTANHLSWFMECKDRNNRSAITLPYSFLPSMAARNLRDAAEKTIDGVPSIYDQCRNVEEFWISITFLHPLNFGSLAPYNLFPFQVLHYVMVSFLVAKSFFVPFVEPFFSGLHYSVETECKESPNVGLPCGFDYIVTGSVPSPYRLKFEGFGEG